MSELPDEVRAAIREIWHEAFSDYDAALVTLRLMRERGLIVFASELRDEATIERAAQLLGRHGGAKGGRARSERLTPERRSEIARNAARARWDAP